MGIEDGGDAFLSLFEMGMLICFGVSWPVSVYKSITTASAKGKSLLFMAAIWVGYVSGITHKLLYSRDVVLYLYLFNLLMVSVDIVLYFINRRRDKARDAAASAAAANGQPAPVRQA